MAFVEVLRMNNEIESIPVESINWNTYNINSHGKLEVHWALQHVVLYALCLTREISYHAFNLSSGAFDRQLEAARYVYQFLKYWWPQGFAIHTQHPYTLDGASNILITIVVSDYRASEGNTHDHPNIDQPERAR